jgi:hypothetical protein
MSNESKNLGPKLWKIRNQLIEIRKRPYEVNNQQQANLLIIQTLQVLEEVLTTDTQRTNVDEIINNFQAICEQERELQAMLADPDKTPEDVVRLIFPKLEFKSESDGQ